MMLDCERILVGIDWWLHMTSNLAQRLLLALALIGGVFLFAACDRSEFTVRTTVENAASAAEAGFARGDITGVQPFFATTADGANQAGLDETWGALQSFAASLDNSSRVQFHSFDVLETRVHEGGGLAAVTYRLHMSVLRNGEVAFGAVVTQNLALLKIPRGWLISGGDEPQLSEVQGQWPPSSD